MYRLKSMISVFDGKKWDDKVAKFASFSCKSKSTVYRWLTSGAPPNVLDAIQYRMDQAQMPSTSNSAQSP